MKTFLILAIVGFVSGDIGLKLREAGYHYDAPVAAPAFAPAAPAVPATSYGVPSHSVSSSIGSDYQGSSNNGYSSNTGYQGVSDNTGYQTVASTGYQGVASSGNSGYQGVVSSGNSGYHGVASSGNSGYKAVSSEYTAPQQDTYEQPQVQYVDSGAQNVQYSSQYQTASVQKYQQAYTQQPAQVFKHFYVHAAPEEPEQPKFRQPVVLPPPQKHYKVIFIKTPAAAPPPPPPVPVQQQHEEKTIVYVLVPKPEEQQQVVVPKVEQKAPTKPEVFFIKYKGKEGSNQVIENIVNNYNKEQGGNVNFSGVETGGVVANDYVAPSTVSGGQAISSTFGSGEQVPSYQASGYRAAAEAQTGYSSGVQQESFNAIPSSQGVPHESYGPPKFRN